MKNIVFLAHAINRFCGIKLRGVRAAAKARGWTVTEAEFGWTALNIGEIITLLHPDGVIFEGGRLTESADTRPLRKLPVVYLDTDFAPPRGGATVCSDARAVADLVADEILASRPVETAFYTLAPHKDWSIRRARRFRERMRAAKIPCRTLRVADDLTQLRTPFALFAANDASAAAALRYAEQLGLVCPRDFTLVSVDNDELFCEHASPSISSIEQDFYHAGAAAVELLEHLFTHGRCGGCRYIPPKALIRRASSVRPTPHLSLAHKIASLIDVCALNGLTVGKLVTDLGASRRTLETTYKNTYGKTICETILARRFQEVERLLADPTLFIEPIAHRCGWTSSAHLKRLFRQRYGITMSDWRRKHLKPQWTKGHRVSTQSRPS